MNDTYIPKLSPSEERVLELEKENSMMRRELNEKSSYLVRAHGCMIQIQNEIKYYERDINCTL